MDWHVLLLNEEHKSKKKSAALGIFGRKCQGWQIVTCYFEAIDNWLCNKKASC
jgi:hypothetical protein